MFEIRLTQKAVSDMKGIGKYTQKKWGRDQRNHYLSKLDDSFKAIANEPKIGKACDDIRKGYRKYHVGRHLIFYRQSKNIVEIIRVLHDRMDIDIHFTDR